jgi:hypothetical protein
VRVAEEGEELAVLMSLIAVGRSYLGFLGCHFINVVRI